ncbi:MAG: type II toxin-antitoxin system RelE/ParE family toxin [Chitinophagaceae bacterium]|nr:type II toxin-antitoxin system RelE/ParE family toxin [Chitinophagaceae bacterium]
MAEEIVVQIFWSDSAKKSFQKIIAYLEKEWSEKEAATFVKRVSAMLLTLQKYPDMCRPSTKRKNVRIGILDKHTQLIYHYKPRKKQIEVLLFWGMKQNPSRLKY